MGNGLTMNVVALKNENALPSKVQYSKYIINNSYPLVAGKELFHASSIFRFRGHGLLYTVLAYIRLHL